MLARPEVHFFNDDGLFDGLAQLDPKSIRKKNQFRVPKAAQMESQAEFLAKKHELLLAQMAAV